MSSRFSLVVSLLSLLSLVLTPSRAVANERCSKEQFALAHSVLTGTIATIKSPDGSGVGVLFHSRRYVVTAMSLVETGRGVHVRVGGKNFDSRIVAIDDDAGVAILELSMPVAHAPLRAAQVPATIGDPVLAGTVTYEINREPDTVVTKGVVTSVHEDRFRTNALGAHERWGAPVLDCGARVVGVSTTAYGDQIATIDQVVGLVDQIGSQEEYTGKWSILHPYFGMATQIAHRPEPGAKGRQVWMGPSMGIALIAEDRWYFPVQYAATFLVRRDDANPLVAKVGVAMTIEAAIGYRFLLMGGEVPLYLVPTIGGTLNWQNIKTTTTALDGGILSSSLVETNLVRMMPSIGLDFQFGFGRVGYQFTLDTNDFARSIHQVNIGFEF